MKMDKTVLCSIKKLVDYLKQQEEKHYAECGTEERKNHIYNDTLKIEMWLGNKETKLDRKNLMNRLKRYFIEGDKKEPFRDREYVEESKRLFDLYGGTLAEGSATDRASYDIVTDLIREIQKDEVNGKN